MRKLFAGSSLVSPIQELIDSINSSRNIQSPERAVSIMAVVSLSREQLREVLTGEAHQKACKKLEEDRRKNARDVYNLLHGIESPGLKELLCRISHGEG